MAARALIEQVKLQENMEDIKSTADWSNTVVLILCSY